MGDVFFPGSKVPFNPINPWGRKAAYPDGWKSPMREPLFQVHVMDNERGVIPIGPKVANDLASELCAATRLAIKTGRITGWSDPTVLPAPAERLKGWALN
jgi:hypothetical protein